MGRLPVGVDELAGQGMVPDDPPGRAGDRPRPAHLLRDRCLRDPALRRETEEGLDVVRSWNSADTAAAADTAGTAIGHGKGGEIASNRREGAETTASRLRILQASPGYVDTPLLWDVLAEPARTDLAARLSPGATVSGAQAR
ncbi:Tn3 family transposase [Streptomyces sp. Tue 6430]|nr:Tn3 family transposase [Streptomyces sp. Tue 6430]